MDLSERTKVNLTVGSFILCLIFIVSSTFALGSWTSGIEGTIEVTKIDILRIEECEDASSERIAELEKSDNKQSVLFAEIKKDLEYIKVMIIDLSEAVK